PKHRLLWCLLDRKQAALVPHAMRTAIIFNNPEMQAEYFFYGEIQNHLSARFFNVVPYSRTNSWYSSISLSCFSTGSIVTLTSSPKAMFWRFNSLAGIVTPPLEPILITFWIL